MLSRRRWLPFVIGGVLVLGLGVGAGAYLHVRSVLQQASLEARHSDDAPVAVIPVQTVVSPFSGLGVTADLIAALPFKGDLYLCGKSALIQVHDGAIRKYWRAGADIPPFALRTAAIRTGIPEQELWIGTEGGGVLIFNGSSFHQLLPKQVRTRQITALLSVRAGNMLIGTVQDGLYTSDGSSLQRFHTQFAKTAVTALAGDEDALWIGTRADGAWFWRGGQAQHVLQPLSDPAVLSLAARANRAWAGTPFGVDEFVDGSLTRHLAPATFARAMAEHNDSLYIATLDEGLVRVPLHAQTRRRETADNFASSEAVNAFADWNGHLFGVYASAVRTIDGARASDFELPSPFSADYATSLNVDSRGRLWIGYFDRGLDILDLHAAATQLKHFEDDVLFCINRIKEDPSGAMTAVATADGLAMFDTSPRLREVLDQHGAQSRALIASNVTDVLFRDNGGGTSMLVATPSGLTAVDNGAANSLSAFQGLVNNHVYTLAENAGTLYAGTLGGVSVLKSGLVQASFTTANSGLRQNWITASAVFEGSVYLGTYGSGVLQFSPDGTAHAYPAFAKTRVEINANAMVATSHALYAGTAGLGLAVLLPKSDRWRFIQDGLPSLNVTALTSRDGVLYVGTENGLVRAQEGSLLP